MEKSTFTRQELYVLVWTVPLSQLAKKYDISDNGLRKKCKKLNIPLPEVGYWQKLQYNKPVTKTKLPKENPAGIETIDLAERKEEVYPENSPAARIKKIRNSYNQLDQKIFKVSSRLSNPDKLIVEAQNTLKQGEVSEWSKGLVNTHYEQIEIKVAPSNVNRALRIFDSLIKLLRLRDHDVKVRYGTTYAIVEGEEIEIALREKLRIEKTTDEHSWTSNKYFPTNKLILKIDRYTIKEFIDGKLTLEEMLPDILANLEYRGKKGKECRIQREIERAKEEELERIRKEQKARKERELADVKKLFKESEAWHKSTNLYNYIQEVEKRAVTNNTMTEEKQTWLTWAKQKADWYNPFIKREDEFLDADDRFL